MGFKRSMRLVHKLPSALLGKTVKFWGTPFLRFSRNDEAAWTNIIDIKSCHYLLQMLGCEKWGERHMSKAEKHKPKRRVKNAFGGEIKHKDEAFVLFYASWCPFSQRFLPIFEKLVQSKPQSCLRIKIDDKTSLCERYSVDVVPTVLFFENGKVAKRLDGVSGAGLSEKQFTDFINKCS